MIDLRSGCLVVGRFVRRERPPRAGLKRTLRVSVTPRQGWARETERQGELRCRSTSRRAGRSLPALALRWLTAHPYGPALADAPEAARAIGLALAGALALATAAVCWPPLRGRRPSPRAEVGLMVAVVLLAVPHTWYHHYTVAVIPLAALLADPEPRSRGWWLALGAGYGAIQIFGPTWHGLVTIVGRTGALPLLDLATLGMLVIWALLARDVRRTRGLEEVSRQPQVGS